MTHPYNFDGWVDTAAMFDWKYNTNDGDGDGDGQDVVYIVCNNFLR